MKAWKTPPTHEDHDTAPLFAKMERVEGLALRAVEDEGDVSFSLLSLIVGWMAILQKRIGVAERWNRRAARKREMLASEALRMNMCDRLGGVEALERWEERARQALSSTRQAGDPGLRRDDGFNQESPTPTPSPRRKPGSPEGVREFALARLPGRGVRRVAARFVLAALKHETPIPVWPCEVMPERFKREWWKGAPEGQGKRNKNTDAFPKNRSAVYPGSRDGRADGDGAMARDPGLNPGMRAGGERSLNVGGPAAAQRAASPGARLCAFP